MNSKNKVNIEAYKTAYRAAHNKEANIRMLSRGWCTIGTQEDKSRVHIDDLPKMAATLMDRICSGYYKKSAQITERKMPNLCALGHVEFLAKLDEVARADNPGLDEELWQAILAEAMNRLRS